MPADSFLGAIHAGHFLCHSRAAIVKMVDVAVQREVLAPLPSGKVVPATELRGTIMTTSLALVREHGLEARYWSLLDPDQGERIRTIGTISWVPVDLAVAHYQVLDQLFPQPSQQVENGRLSSERTQSAYLRTLFKLLQSSGQLSPAVALRKLPTVFGRMWNGGGAATAYQTGRKDARVELLAYPICASSYVKNAWQGMFENGLAPTARRVFVRIDTGFSSTDRAAYDISWA